MVNASDFVGQIDIIDLAKKMISESLLKRSDTITTFKSKDLFESMSFI